MTTRTKTMTKAEEALLAAADEGRVEEIPGLLRALDPAQRRACLAELKRMRTRLRSAEWAPPPKPQRRRVALYLAGTGCQSGAAAAAQWISAEELRYDMRDLLSWDGVLEVLSEQTAEWMEDLAGRLATRRSTALGTYGLIDGLVRRSGCPVPTTDGVVRGWMSTITRAFPPQPEDGTLTERLRADAFTPYMLPRLFEVEGIGADLIWGWSYRKDRKDEDEWPTALTALAAEGTVDRDALIDGCVSRMLRGERPGALRGFSELLAALDPSQDELAARTGDWVRLVSDAPSPVAGRAQEFLRRLWEAGRLEADSLGEASRNILFRPDKTLVRAQLVLLGKALARDRASAAVLLPAVTEAFGHEDTLVQERALKLVSKYIDSVDAQLRAELAQAAESLDTGLRDLAAEVFGGPPEDSVEPPPYEESLPAVAGRRPLAPPMESPYEVAEEVGAFLAASAGSSMRFERILDGLVRHTYRDRAALTKALEPINDQYLARLLELSQDEEQTFVPRTATRVAAAWLGHPAGFVRFVLAGVMSQAGALPETVPPEKSCEREAYQDVVRARVLEVAERTMHDPLPFLLATPSHDDHTIDPRVLLERLREYRGAGVEPGRRDFEQALLRVRTSGPRDFTLDAAVAEERRLAAWLDAGGLPAPDQQRAVVDPVAPRGWPEDRHWRRRVLVGTGESPVLRTEFGEAFSRLALPQSPTLHSCFHWGGEELWADYWLAVLPEQRERLAARLLHQVADGTSEASWGGALHLPVLAEAPGPAGPAMHLAMAYGLGARSADDRRAAVDAALVVAATGSLDTEALGRDLAELVALGMVKPNRLADACRSAARTGAYRTVWEVLAAALPMLLAEGADHRGLGEVLALGAECAETCGAGGVIPEVDRIAAATGSTQLVKQARRLRTVLASGAAR
jgi:hypothetical protein